MKELELELSKCSQADKLQSSLQERLTQEKSRAGEAQKKVGISWGMFDSFVQL